MIISRPLLFLLLSAVPALAQDEDLADFGQTIQVNGDMVRTDQDFKDGLAIDLFSATPRTFTVSKKQPPSLPCNFVTGTTGEPFICLSAYSWIIKFNETVHDLVGGKIELPYEPEALAKAGVTDDNTYVGKLASDGKSWIVLDGDRNIHRSENKTRALKQNSLDGEWMLLGRKLQDTANVLVQYGYGVTRTVNITGGKGRQEAEFVDGLRLSVISQKKMEVNIDVPTLANAGIRDAPQGWKFLNPYAWVVNTSNPNAQVDAGMSIPVNQLQLQSKLSAKSGCADVALGLSASDSTVKMVGDAKKVPLDVQFSRSDDSIQSALLGMSNDEFRMSATGVKSLDGKFVLMYKPDSLGDCTGICNALGDTNMTNMGGENTGSGTASGSATNGTDASSPSLTPTNAATKNTKISLTAVMFFGMVINFII